jgi:hypothetical protein
MLAQPGCCQPAGETAWLWKYSGRPPHVELENLSKTSKFKPDTGTVGLLNFGLSALRHGEYSGKPRELIIISTLKHTRGLLVIVWINVITNRAGGRVAASVVSIDCGRTSFATVAKSVPARTHRIQVLS